MTTVDEAIAVLREEANTPRARAVLSMLSDELGSSDRSEDPPKTSRKPVFPSKDNIDQLLSAKGGNSPDEDGAKGTATARKGT